MLKFIAKLSEDTEEGGPLLRVEGTVEQSITHTFWEDPSGTGAHLKSSLNQHLYITPAPHSYNQLA